MMPDEYPAGTVFVQIEGSQCFFGYYDLQPWNPSRGNMLLFTAAPRENVSPHDIGASLDICTAEFSGSGNRPEITKIATTSSWNWQQGCRLQWFDESRLIFNTVLSQGYGAHIINSESGALEHEISAPIYDLHAAQSFGLGLDFSRLHRFRRGYGYHQFVQKSRDMAPDNDGIYRVDIKSGRQDLIVPLSALAGLDPRPDMNGAHHYFNHIKINPSGTRFLCFHLWLTVEGKRRSRMFTANVQGEGFHLLAEGITPSHYCWMDDDRILLTGKQSGAGECYAIVKDDDSAAPQILVGENLSQDGHPTFLGHDRFISDTYPDVWGRQTLFYSAGGRYQKIARAKVPTSFHGEMRCDMHPRVSPDKEWICTDVVRHNARALAIMPFSVSSEEE